jgi:hypothetical protein
MTDRNGKNSDKHGSEKADHTQEHIFFGRVV